MKNAYASKFNFGGVFCYQIGIPVDREDGSMKYLCMLPLLVILCGSAEARQQNSVFDKPLKEVAVSLPPDAQNPSAEREINCYYYGAFMVKEVDLGEIGAEKLSIVPVLPDRATPCRQDDPEEILIEDWSGYFKGVKGRYVFFDAEDGVDGGLSFAVFDSKDGRKQFSDTGQLSGESIHKINLSGDALVIRYRRIYQASCSLYEKPSNCWNLIRKEIVVDQGTPAPDCRKAYETEQQSASQSPSIIGYEAELTHTSGNTKIISQPGEISCMLPD